MKRVSSILLLIAVVSCAYSQRTDLSGIKICIDPGHGGHNPSNDRLVIPDPGTQFWESESNFQKALFLKSLLEAKGATVVLTRTTNDYPNDDEPTLAARVRVAIDNNVNWFHSIHSNASGLSSNTSINYSMIMVREKVVAGGDAVYGPGTGQPETQEAWNIADLLGPSIRDKMRTQRSLKVLDWTFYGGSNGGYTLGVLRGLPMPGELSEGEFHDYFPVTRLLMNNSYCKMEAYAIRDAFLTYFGVPADSMGIVAGTVSEPGTGKTIDAVQVRLLPENIVYNGDLYHNGFYMFDGIRTGTHWVRFETPGYFRDSIQITIAKGETKFADRQIESTAPPIIVASSVTNNDTSFSAAGPIQFTFSKIMDTASIRSSFSIVPPVKGSLLWSANNMGLTFKPDSVVLPFDVLFTIRIEGSARSQSGMFLDGNGDGASGDAFQVKFKTRPVDAWPPVITSVSPPNTSSTVASNTVVNVTFDEPLDPSSVNSTNIILREVGAGNRPLVFQYDTKNSHGGVSIVPQGGLSPGKSYLLRVSGMKDLAGNAMPSLATSIVSFSVAPLSFQYTVIEDFSTSVSSWFKPQDSGSTIGADSATFALDSLVTLSSLSGSSHSGRLTYKWNTTTATDWMIREYLNSGSGRSITWNKRGSRLQAYVWGDGSGTLFRFAVDDSIDVFPNGTTQNHEVSAWTPIDWVGWRLVEWDMENDSVGTWLGNGKLEGMLRFDSFQLKYVEGAKITSGTIYVAQLQLARGTVTGVQAGPGSVPSTFSLQQNYPNPFNPTTNIEFRIANLELVTLKVFDVLGREISTLVNEVRPAGVYTVRWDASSFPSGVYFYRLQAREFVQTKKMVLAK